MTRIRIVSGTEKLSVEIRLLVRSLSFVFFSRTALFTSKVTPAPQKKVQEKEEGRSDGNDTKPFMEIYVMSLYDFLKELGGHRFPKVKSHETYMKDGLLHDASFLHKDSKLMYLSHEPVGTDHPDPPGEQLGHGTKALRRLGKGEVKRTDMDPFHSLLYKQTFTTTAKDWKRMLNPEKTYIWYDGFSVPKEKRDEAFRFIPEIIKRCDFMIILAPGCRHFDKIDPRTGRKKNLCYRTYRQNAMCVYEVFCAFLTTKGGEQVRPALLVRSGKGNPNWSSPLECQKLFGTSIFECCANNHKNKECRRPICSRV